eukprot:COSAG02_NODE_11675_length_1676_cov_1.379201_1_plen_36_part_10
MAGQYAPFVYFVCTLRDLIANQVLLVGGKRGGGGGG